MKIITKNFTDNINEVYNEFLKDKPYIIGTDTETTGLNQIFDKPFQIVFGWLQPKEYIKVFTFDISDLNKELYWKMISNSNIKYHFMFNAKFDIGMLLNISLNLTTLNNIYEGMCIPRLLFNYYDKRCPLALKKFSELYYDKDAKLLQDKLTLELKLLIKNVETKRNKLLLEASEKKWNVAILNRYQKDIFLDEKIPNEILELWEKIKLENPLPNYMSLPKQLLDDYSSNDIVLLLGIVNKYLGSLTNPASPNYQLDTLIRESEFAKTLAIIEKNGMCVDKEYLELSRKKVKDLILLWYDELWLLLGEELNVGQHKELIKWFDNNQTPLFNRKLNVKDAQDDTLLYTIEKLELIDAKDKKKKKNTIRICELIRKLRSYVKWYSTYITHYLENLVKINNEYFIFGSINAFGTQTGRCSSSWQQFPREGLTNCFCERKPKTMCYNSEHLVFKPRAIFKPRNKDNYLGYLDYSQIELRVAAAQTLKINKPDETFLNAYYNYNNKENWKPIDLHTNSAEKIYNIDKTSKRFKELRVRAKIANFTILYGGTDYAINQYVYEGKNELEAKMFYKKFKEIYPGITAFQSYCANQAINYGYIKNDFNRIYRWASPNFKSTREAGSCMIQGGCADFLKDRMIEVQNYLLNTNSNIKIINAVHDEIQFDIPKQELNKVNDIKKIMEYQEVWNVPIICDIELSNTNWADKKAVKEIINGEIKYE